MGLRHEGSDELGDILLGISSRLQTFDFQDTFTDAFEVGLKCGFHVSTLFELRFFLQC